MTILERLLLALSYAPGTPAPPAPNSDWTTENALELLSSAFPGFVEAVRGRSVLDFGCGTGFQCAALARAGAERVVGIDSNPRVLAEARALVERLGLSGRIALRTALAPADAGAHDLVISQHSMEHYGRPLETLRLLRTTLAGGGRIHVAFGPPWFAPRGSHMQFFTPVPWLNLLFPEATVMAVRARFRDDGATRYEDVESGLNRMTVGKFERLVAEAGLHFIYRRYRGVKGLDFLGRLPGLRELFINEVHAVLAPADGTGARVSADRQVVSARPA